MMTELFDFDLTQLTAGVLQFMEKARSLVCVGCPFDFSFYQLKMGSNHARKGASLAPSRAIHQPRRRRKRSTAAAMAE